MKNQKKNSKHFILQLRDLQCEAQDPHGGLDGTYLMILSQIWPFSIEHLAAQDDFENLATPALQHHEISLDQWFSTWGASVCSSSSEI